MEFETVLAARRMCRSFRAEPIDDPTLDRVLAAACRAPAAGNTWPLDLVVLRGDDVDGYWARTLPAGVADFPWPGLLRAPVLVIPVVEPAAYLRRYRDADKARTGLGGATSAWTVPYWWVDGGAAVMAMLLAAEDAALGALFFGLFDHEATVADWLAIPDGRRALGTLALGYADGGRSASRSSDRGRPAPGDIRHNGRW